MLAFCAFVLPWPWTLLRAAAGVVVVVAAVALGRRFGGEGVETVTPAPRAVVDTRDEPDPHGLAVRFPVALRQLTLRLLPIPTGAEVAIIAAMVAVVGVLTSAVAAAVGL